MQNIVDDLIYEQFQVEEEDVNAYLESAVIISYNNHNRKYTKPRDTITVDGISTRNHESNRYR